MKRVLVAYDGSAGAEAAIREMSHGGLPRQADALVLTVAEVWLPPAPGPDSPPGVAASIEKAAEAVREAKQIAIQGAVTLHGAFPNWNVGNQARSESAAWGILAEAQSWKADLIVVGSHGRTPLERFFLGSVSFRVAAEAKCSVRIERPHPGDRRIGPSLLVALDGSDDSKRAIDEALERVWRHGTQVHLVSVLDAKQKRHLAGAPAGLEPDCAGQEIEDRNVQLLEQARTRFGEKGIKAEFHVLEGSPKHEILRMAEKLSVDCIMLGARGLDHGDRLYLGTTACAIATRAHCSVEIVRAANP